MNDNNNNNDDDRNHDNVMVNNIENNAAEASVIGMRLSHISRSMETFHTSTELTPREEIFFFCYFSSARAE